MTNYYKLIGLATFLSTAALPSFSQNTSAVSPARATWQLGLGTAGMGTGDYICFKTHVEYMPLFGRHLGTGTRLAFISGSRESYNWLNYPSATSNGIRVPFVMSYQALNAEQEVYIYPFGNDQRVLFSLGGGGYLGYSNRYGAPAMRSDFTTGVPSVVLDHGRGMHVGYMFSLNLDAALDANQNWTIGGKASFQNDTFGNSLASLQIKLGHRF